MRIGVRLILCLGAFVAGSAAAGEDRPLKITITYDNVTATESTREDWGFSCLVEGREKTILFDTGRDPEVLQHNFAALGIEPGAIDAVFLSHEHRDHTGGLSSVLEKSSQVEVCILASFPEAIADEVRKHSATPVRVTAPVEIAPGVRSTGEMGTEIPEHALVIDTPEGLVVISGCAHPGIVDMVRAAKETTGRNVHLVLGGFHLLRSQEDEVRAVIHAFQELGVAKAGASHCSGDAAMALFKEAYGEDFLELGAGRVLTVGGR